jgi:hypothetical protein
MEIQALPGVYHVLLLQGKWKEDLRLQDLLIIAVLQPQEFKGSNQRDK